MDRFKTVGEEIIYAQGLVVSINNGDLAMLKHIAEANPRKRVRICAHPDIDDTLHASGLLAHQAQGMLSVLDARLWIIGQGFKKAADHRQGRT